MKKMSKVKCLASLRSGQKSKVEKGLTLIELLVVVLVIGSIMAIAVGIVTSTLRGTNKTAVINKVRENGNYAISQISRTIKYSKAIEGASVSGSPPWECQLMQPPAPTPTPKKYAFVRVNSFDGTATTFACDTDNISANGDPIIDGGPSGSVSLSPGSCFFTCSKERITDSPSVGVSFILDSKTTSDLFETKASVPFTILIKGRN